MDIGGGPTELGGLVAGAEVDLARVKGYYREVLAHYYATGVDRHYLSHRSNLHRSILIFTVKCLKSFGIKNAPRFSCSLWGLVSNNLRVIKINSVLYMVFMGRLLPLDSIPSWVDFPIRLINVRLGFR